MKTKLTAKQDAFVKEYAKHKNARKAALEAGYAPSSAHQRGYELVNNSDIQQRLVSLGVVGYNTLEDIAINGRVEVARVNAAKTLVEMAYGKPKDNRTMNLGDITINIHRIDPKELSSTS